MAFIALFLIRDSKRRSSVSWALWIPTLVVLILASRSPSQWLSGGVNYSSGETGTTAFGNMLDQAFYLSMIVGAMLVASSRGVRWGKIVMMNGAIMLFYFYFLISASWSTVPGTSLTRIVKDFGTMIFVISVILSEKDPQEAMRTVFARCSIILFPLSCLFVRYTYHGLGRQYARNGDVMFVGVTTQKNTLGEMVLILSLFLIWDYLESRKGRWDVLALLLMGVYLLNKSQSKTSLVCLIIGMTLIFRGGFFVTSKVINRAILFAALALPFLVLFTQIFGNVFTPILGLLGRDATFTGRTNIWQHITSTTVNPIIGAGYWNFWNGLGGRAIQEAMQWDVPNAHNGYLEMYIDGGYIGLALLFTMLIVSGNKLIKRMDGARYNTFKFAMLVVAIIVNLTESYFARLSLIWFTTLMVAIEFAPLKIEQALVTPGTLRSEFRKTSKFKPKPVIEPDDEPVPSKIGFAPRGNGNNGGNPRPRLSPNRPIPSRSR
jgi:exopolysaccharide production protein ExoQ